MDVKSCQIAIDGTTSSAVDLEDCEILGLIIPALDATNLTFQVCDTFGGTFVGLKVLAGTSALTITATGGNFAVVSNDLEGLRGYRYVQIIASAAQTGGARTFVWLLKKNWRR